ncbi:hypothetical protein pipiens_006757 [Culex pipiens pipiens]|uniref:Uncharacterized protein n=1 Tax=Culex pipiens pipiens TaxID=38569 RepID=A0ABD1DSA2_CULPP
MSTAECPIANTLNNDSVRACVRDGTISWWTTVIAADFPPINVDVRSGEKRSENLSNSPPGGPPRGRAPRTMKP